MFVYQNNDRNICITFEGTCPVETPDYVLVVDEVAKTINIACAEDGEDVSAVAELTEQVKKLQNDIKGLNEEIAEKDALIEELRAELTSEEE
jgi:peptidoglycan hydrolase CwlO-like protein